MNSDRSTENNATYLLGISLRVAIMEAEKRRTPEDIAFLRDLAIRLRDSMPFEIADLLADYMKEGVI